jgi:hypothetical protein
LDRVNGRNFNRFGGVVNREKTEISKCRRDIAERPGEMADLVTVLNLLQPDLPPCVMKYAAAVAVTHGGEDRERWIKIGIDSASVTGCWKLAEAFKAFDEQLMD